MTFDSYDRFPARYRSRNFTRRPRQASQEDVQLYRMANPELVEYLERKAAEIAQRGGTFDFPQKMLEAIATWGGLTENQKAAVERMMARDAEYASRPRPQRAAPPAPAPTPVDFMGTAAAPAEFLGEDPEETAFIAEETVGTEATDPSHPHLLETAAAATSFMTAGNAVVTLKSRVTGNRFTYRLRASQDGRIRFVSLLAGSDNDNSYRYFGYVRDGSFFHGGAKAKVASNAQSVQVFSWAWGQLQAGVIPANLEIWHEGRCGRCGRRLTVPTSIASGIGPECASRMGG